jgi:CubicO group peptidase (beta-lactamase class C family)
MEPLVRSHDFAGAVLVARGDRVLFERGYGLANAELGVPNSPTTVFRIASLTKTFTAAAIVMLAERGVIHYDDSIATYLPGYPNGSRITIRHLLLHAAGVANPPYEEIVTRRLTLPQLIDQFRDRPLLFAPGTESRYSNAGYVLLAAVIERASGMSYGEFIRRNITEPLGLVSTFPDPQEGLVLQRASGYVPGPPPLGLENVAWLPRRLLRRQHVRHLPNEHRGLAERAMREGRRGDGVWRAGRPGVASASDEARVDVAAPDTGRLTAPNVGTFSLSLQNGRPFVKWVTARTAHYATPVGTDSLFVHADRSLIVLDRDAGGRLQGAFRVWAGGPPVRFTRQQTP